MANISLCTGDMGNDPALSWGLRRVESHTPPLEKPECTMGVVRLDVAKRASSPKDLRPGTVSDPQQSRFELPLPDRAPYSIYVDFIYHSVFGDDFVALRIAPSREAPSDLRFPLKASKELEK